MFAKHEIAAVLFHDLLDDGQAKAGPSFAGGDIGFRQTVPFRFGQAAAVVADAHLRLPVGGPGLALDDERCVLLGTALFDLLEREITVDVAKVFPRGRTFAQRLEEFLEIQQRISQ